MNRHPTVVVTAAIAVLLLGVVTVQTVDPFQSPPDGPTRVNLDGEPVDVAKDALRIPQNLNHTQNFTQTFVSDSENRTIVGSRRLFRYQPSRRRYSITKSYNGSLPAEPEVESYGSANTAWITSSTSASGWREIHSYRYGRVVPFDPPALDDTTVRVESENETTLVLYVEASRAANRAMDNTLVHYPNATDELWLYIDKDSRRLDKIINRPTGAGAGESDVKNIFELEYYGNTTVDRPEDVPTISVRAILWDVLNGPVFELRDYWPYLPF